MVYSALMKRLFCVSCKFIFLQDVFLSSRWVSLFYQLLSIEINGPGTTHDENFEDLLACLSSLTLTGLFLYFCTIFVASFGHVDLKDSKGFCQTFSNVWSMPSMGFLVKLSNALVVSHISVRPTRRHDPYRLLSFMTFLLFEDRGGASIN